MATSIEWTRGDDGTPGETWNPVVGCDRVSPGCDRCYAIGVAHRKMQPAHVGLTVKRPGEPTDWTGVVRCLPERLDIPLRWKRPRRVFVNSMSDLFHPDVPTDFIARTFAVMALARRHTFQVLTKRPQRMPGLLVPPFEKGSFKWYAEDHVGDWDSEFETIWPLPNVWLGTSIESARYTYRANALRSTPAAVRFLSVEPMLGPVDNLDLAGIDWVIVGAESGPRARPMELWWIRDLRDRCRDLGIAFFVKQLTGSGGHPIKNIDDFPIDLRIREYPT